MTDESYCLLVQVSDVRRKDIFLSSVIAHDVEL